MARDAHRRAVVARDAMDTSRPENASDALATWNCTFMWLVNHSPTD